VPKLALIQALETRLINAWPAFEVEVAEGWILRFAEGYSKRANAATPLIPGAELDPALIEHMLMSFEERAVAPCFRLTGIEDRRCEDMLAAKGLVDFDPSLCLMAPLGLELDRDPAVIIRGAAKTAWITAAASAYGGEKANAERLGRIVRLIRQPAAFATLSLDSEDAAWGLAVAERGYVGLYDIVVSPDLRGIGLGRRVVASLMAWGCGEGAHTAYLQVREENEIARSLYVALGFGTAYRYTHRVMPGRSPA
jgi:ribosomal protein S18 acetylase RimI-like enzyme